MVFDTLANQINDAFELKLAAAIMLNYRIY